MHCITQYTRLTSLLTVLYIFQINRFNFTGRYEKLPKDTHILVIHGKLDEIVPFSSSEEIVLRMPQAQRVVIGSRPGQIPNLSFGHHWFEYFDVQVWHDVVETFLATGGRREARL